MMIRTIELGNCPQPYALLRAAAATLPSLAELVEGLAAREIERGDGGREWIQPHTAELPGARVHVVPLVQEMRADGTITPPAAVVIVDGPDAERIATRLDKALLAGAQVKADHAELAHGARLVLAGPALAETGAPPRREKAERLAAADAVLEAAVGEARRPATNERRQPHDSERGR